MTESILQIKGFEKVSIMRFSKASPMLNKVSLSWVPQVGGNRLTRHQWLGDDLGGDILLDGKSVTGSNEGF